MKYIVLLLVLVLLLVGCNNSKETNNAFYINQCQNECISKDMVLKGSPVDSVKIDEDFIYCYCERVITIER